MIKPLQNAPLWPPNPSNQEAASPGPQQEDKVKGPPQSSGQKKAVPHHSSPTPGDKQTPAFPVPPQNIPAKNKQTINRMPDVPMHKTKHSEPVGRPKKRNEY